MQRVDKFVGTQEQYIAYLESRCMEQSQLHRVLSQKYERLLRHHESCAASIIQYNNDLRPYGASPESSSFLQYQKSLNSNGSHRKFIHWNYSAQRFHLKQAIRRPPQVPRWQHLADDLIEKTPIGSRWWTMLSDIGIGSLSEVSTALEFLLEHNTSTAIFPRLPSTEVAIVQPARCDMLLDYVTAYATALKARDISTNVTSMLVNFSKFLFVDLCIVLESEGVEKDDVNNMMRITISDATDLSLDRIKRAVKWTNSMCDKLSARWGLRAGMLPLIWKRPPSYYVQFAENNDSLDYILKRLSQNAYTDLFVPKPKDKWTDLFKPVLVEYILRKSVPIASVAGALGYQNSEMLEKDGTLIVEHPWLLFD